MADGREAKRRFGRRGRARGRADERPLEADGQGDAAQAQRPPAVDVPSPVCGICGKPIFDLASALAGRDNNLPVHFDCALARVSEGEHLEPGEKITYIGRGAFAVVEFRDRSQTAFSVKRRIQWEKEGEKFEWRRSIMHRSGL